MRELQNVSLVLLTLTLGVVFISLQGCTNIQAQIPILEPKPEPVMPAPGIEPCWEIERYHFDTPGIEPHEVKTPKKCERLIS